jgi:toxin FitB
MILLDTNIVSEAMKPQPDPSVRDWLDAQVAETLFLSSVTVAELLFGIGVLPDGKRKDNLTAALHGVMELFGSHILSFDTDAAQRYAVLAVRARSAGKGFPTPDGYSCNSFCAWVCGRIAGHECISGCRSDRDQSLDEFVRVSLRFSRRMSRR